MRLFSIELQENKHLGAKKWPCYNEIPFIVRGAIMRLNCTISSPGEPMAHVSYKMNTNTASVAPLVISR